jgi:hypothetical protein
MISQTLSPEADLFLLRLLHLTELGLQRCDGAAKLGLSCTRLKQLSFQVAHTCC